MKYIRVFTILLIVNCSLFIFHCSGAQVNQVDSGKIIYKIILKDGGVFNGSTENKKVYIITEFARLKIFLWDLDSVDIGILPDFDREKKIVKMLMRLSSESCRDKACLVSTYNKILALNIEALPVIRNYIENSEIKKPANISDTLTPENALQHLMIKYKTDRNFVDRDILYMHQSFKLGGIMTVKKKRALIRFDNFAFPREDIKKIIILHKK
jgi:hypothetical protein